jgi:hypothetical protein
MDLHYTMPLYELHPFCFQNTWYTSQCVLQMFVTTTDLVQTKFSACIPDMLVYNLRFITCFPPPFLQAYSDTEPEVTSQPHPSPFFSAFSCVAESADSGTLALPTATLNKLLINTREPGLSWGYSDWLRAGRPRDRSSYLDRGNISVLFTPCTPFVGPNQLPFQWITETLSPEIKELGRDADYSPPTNEIKKMLLTHTQRTASRHYTNGATT